MIFKWYYKGRYNDDPVAFPLSKVTKLGLGDMMDIGVYTLLTGLMSLGGSVEKLRERQIGHMDKQMEELHGFIPR